MRFSDISYDLQHLFTFHRLDLSLCSAAIGGVTSQRELNDCAGSNPSGHMEEALTSVLMSQLFIVGTEALFTAEMTQSFQFIENVLFG